jgi:DNA (cytosine-5)-methyltransferase 1
MQPTAIDLFCGCGGISAGLRQAGFSVVAGADVDQSYLSTFKKNFPTSKSLGIDLCTIEPSDFMDAVGIRSGQLDILAGGPPCQGFSKNVPRKSRRPEDPRNMLVHRFLDYCEALRPKMVLMENVAEMKNGFNNAYSDEIMYRLKMAGYVVSYSTLNSANYGVPQRRKRAFFIANRFGKTFCFPEPTHVQHGAIQGLFPKPAFITVWEAIGDLPSRGHGSGKSPDAYTSAPFSEYQANMRNGANVLLNHVARALRPMQFKRLSSIEPGQGLKDLPEELKIHSGYSGAYGRLAKEMIAPTVTRWLFHPGSGRWGHPVDIRTITIRESARIQSFHDDYEFVGTYNQQSGQIGNAVPPQLVEQIALSMLSQMENIGTRLG